MERKVHLTSKVHGFTIILLLIGQTIFAGSEVGVKASVGVSRITNSLTEYNPNEFDDITTLLAPSAKVGISYSMKGRYFFGFSVEVFFSQITGKETIDYSGFYLQGNPYPGSGSSVNKFDVSYFTLPAYLDFHIKKLTVGLGFQGGVNVRARLHFRAETRVLNQDRFSEYVADFFIEKYDWGPIFNLSYRANEKLIIEADCYVGKANIYDNLGYYRKVRQFGVGVNYLLITQQRRIRKADVF